MVDVGVGQCRQAGADRRRHQHIDLGEHLGGEGFQDRPAAAERFDIVRRRDGIAGIHPPADMRAIGLRIGAHPFGVDCRRLDAGDDAAVGRDRIHQRQSPAGDHVAPRAVSTASAFSIAAITGSSASSKKTLVGTPIRMPADVAGHRGFVIRHRLARAGRILRIMAGDDASCTRAQSRAVRVNGPTLSCVNDSGMTP